MLRRFRVAASNRRAFSRVGNAYIGPSNPGIRSTGPNTLLLRSKNEEISYQRRKYATSAQRIPEVSRKKQASTKKTLVPGPLNYTKKKLPADEIGAYFSKLTRVYADARPVLRNPVGVQLLSRPLHAQIFRNTSFPTPPETSITLSKRHLQAHGLNPADAQVLPNISFTLPPLEGPTIDGHFYNIAYRLAQPSRTLAERFAQVDVPSIPPKNVWVRKSGWTRYTLDAGNWKVEEGVGPYEEDTLVFDVETMPKYHKYAIMATAASPTAWYAWISPWLLGESEDGAHLIPLGVAKPGQERIVEYDLRPGHASGVRWVDTLALHVAVRGISSVQRPAWMKWRKDAARQANGPEEAEDLSSLSPFSEARLAADQRAEADAAALDAEEDDAQHAHTRWEEITSVNSLLEVAKLHCGITMNKETRNAFMHDTPAHILADLETYLDYCANDVGTTHAVFQKVLPKFFEACAHPASWAGIMRMGSSFLPVNQEWERYLERAESKYREIEGAVKRKLAALAEEARTLMESGAWKGDVFLEQMDWTPKVAGKSRGFWVPTKKQREAMEKQRETMEKKREAIEKPASSKSKSSGTLAWLAELTEDPTSTRARDVLIPLLLQAQWNNNPMFYSSQHGWLYRAPSAKFVPEAGFIVTLTSDDPVARFQKDGTLLVRPAELDGTSEPLWSTKLGGELLKARILSTKDDKLAIALTNPKVTQNSVNALMKLAKVTSMPSAGRRPLALQQLDWTVTAEEGAVDPTPDMPSPPEGLKYPAPTWPQWYWDLAKPRPDAPLGTIDVTVRNRMAPLLLRLGWLGNPLVYSRQHGWCYRVQPVSTPVQEESPPETADRNQPLTFQHEDDEQWRIQSTQEGYQFFKLPHAHGQEANVGNPLSKSFLKYAQDGTLKSIPKDEGTVSANVNEVLGVPGEDTTDQTRNALDMNAQCSYWISARDRVLNQMIVWEKDAGALGMGKTGTPDEKWGLILPQVITMGTVTRRAVEVTWLTASNAKKNRIGSELKAMVRAPPGYSIVGADVDSEELWISSVMGDAQFGMHGATAIGWMTLEGTKKAGTDLHSKTASILGISRDTAKVFNYSRIYGAGMRHAVLLLMQANAGMSTAEAQKLAEKLYASTKGTNMHSPRWFGRKFWYGGTESFLFNKLEAIAHSERPMTPALGCGVTSALSKKHLSDEFGSDYLTSRINWVVQSSGVDYLHLLITAMDHLVQTYSIQARYMISVHDEVRYLVKEEDKYRAALALQIANLWTRSLFAFKLGLDDLPTSVGFFSAVDIDFVLRKEVDMDCVTPSQPIPLAHGESLDIKGVLEKTKNGSLWPDRRPMEEWRSRPKEPGMEEGYSVPDCTGHRAEGPEFLSAQSTNQLSQVKKLGTDWADKLRAMGRGTEVDQWMSKAATGRQRDRARRDALMLKESFGSTSPRFSLEEMANILSEP
ncbi:hypothetical protein M408DRAFT_331614 [Serendipita vermifera MAFF 305830]|uniref:Mitochondrial DNA polymerase catalytic subunit n=1 Tax=Serendipita vermifera MAFF 305830 TaxID=933852 RepID=A0A0C3AZV0_SERVB|nr:hypothetical protein M408DRAFT_331614 [Serendipita vermifera MAFF 305830]